MKLIAIIAGVIIIARLFNLAKHIRIKAQGETK
jgi:hypothetical protein